MVGEVFWARTNLEKSDNLVKVTAAGAGVTSGGKGKEKQKEN